MVSMDVCERMSSEHEVLKRSMIGDRVLITVEMIVIQLGRLVEGPDKSRKQNSTVDGGRQFDLSCNLRISLELAILL